MTAIAERHEGRAYRYAAVYTGVFALLTVVSVLYRFAEDRVALLWRRWLTRYLIDRYLTHFAYYRLIDHPDLDNPDQRIAEDVKLFTTTTLSFVLILTNSAITLIAFCGILWSITPWLLVAAVLYAVVGSAASLALGHKLVGLNIRLQRREADLRFELIRVRENAEGVALSAGEAAERGRLLTFLRAVVDISKRIIGVQRNLGFFTTGYNYLTQLIPVLIVFPLFIAGAVEFGAVTQAQMAFAHVLGAFSLFVAEFTRITTFAAVTSRLGEMSEVLDELPGVKPGITIAEDPSRVAFEQLTLRTPGDGRELVRDLTVEVPRGRRLLVSGPIGSGRSALFRAVAGLWTAGAGRIIRPPRGEVIFLPQHPYLVPGNLREQVRYGTRPNVTDDEILEVLNRVRFGPALERVGGLDAVGDWPIILSQGEQQLIALARLLLTNPPFAFLDEAVSGLDPARARAVYALLAASPITYISAGSGPGLREFHDLLLELRPDGAWRLTPARHEAA